MKIKLDSRDGVVVIKRLRRFGEAALADKIIAGREPFDDWRAKSFAEYERMSIDDVGRSYTVVFTPGELAVVDHVLRSCVDDVDAFYARKRLRQAVRCATPPRPARRAPVQLELPYCMLGAAR